MTRSRCGSGAGNERRRGTIYIAVLSTALIVTIIGLAAVLGARLLQHSTSLTENAVRADLLAQAAMDRALLRLVNDNFWRTRYYHNTWYATEFMGDAATSFKLVDEIDGDLADDATEPVRLYARAAVGDALRIYSVQLKRQMLRNLLLNADMEQGLANWSGSGCQLEPVMDDVRYKTWSLAVKNRTGASSGPRQQLQSALENGSPYRFEVFVKMEGAARYVQPVIEITATESGTQWFTGTPTLVTGTWTRVAAMITPEWYGTLESAAVYVTTTANTTPFRIDDASLTNGNPLRWLVMVPGTWRREISPAQSASPPTGGSVDDEEVVAQPLRSDNAERNGLDVR